MPSTGKPIPTKEPVVSLVERGGRVRSFHVPDVTAKTLRTVLVTQIERKSYLMTDESGSYVAVGREFAGHGTVNHSIEEYVRGGFWHTNTAEGYFAILKRGIYGTYHHVSQAHLKRYVATTTARSAMPPVPTPRYAGPKASASPTGGLVSDKEPKAQAHAQEAQRDHGSDQSGA